MILLDFENIHKLPKVQDKAFSTCKTEEWKWLEINELQTKSRKWKEATIRYLFRKAKCGLAAQSLMKNGGSSNTCYINLVLQECNYLQTNMQELFNFYNLNIRN